MFIATKKRKLREASATDGIVLDDGKEELEECSLKRLRVPPTVTETMTRSELWKKMRADFPP